MAPPEFSPTLKHAVDRLPPDRLASLADYLRFLDRPRLAERIAVAENSIAADGGVNWRNVRADL